MRVVKANWNLGNQATVSYITPKGAIATSFFLATVAWLERLQCCALRFFTRQATEGPSLSRLSKVRNL
jgi:hypothetical protein